MNPCSPTELIIHLYSGYDNSSPAGRYSCPRIGGPAKGQGWDGAAYIHSMRRASACHLARVWGVSEDLVECRDYTPADGIGYLLALFAMHHGGTVFRALPELAGFLFGLHPWQFIVMDRQGMESGQAMRLAMPHVVISIRDPGARPVKLRTNAQCLGVYSIAFQDAEGIDKHRDPKVRLMTEAQAQRMWCFLQQHAGRIEAVVAHCEAGMSRSPATLIGIGRCVGADTRGLESSFNPNRHVIDIVSEAYYRQLWKRARNAT